MLLIPCTVCEHFVQLTNVKFIPFYSIHLHVSNSVSKFCVFSLQAKVVREVTGIAFGEVINCAFH